MRAILISAAVTAFISAPLSAREQVLAPMDDWQVEATGESCLLIRNFRDSSGEGVRFQVQSFQPKASFKITMVGKPLPLLNRSRGLTIVRYRFMPDANWREGMGATGSVGGVNSLTFYADLVSSDQLKRRQQPEAISAQERDRYSITRIAEIDRLMVGFRPRDNLLLQLGPLAEPHEGLQACARELSHGWGYDPSVLDSLKSRPRLQNGEEISTLVLSDLQKAGLRYADAIHYRLDIDEHGGIAGCVVQYPKRADATETTVCGLLKDKARYDPAIDANGNPVRAPVVSRIAFVFP